MKNGLYTTSCHGKIVKTGKLKLTYQNQPLKIEYFLRPGKEQTILYLHGLGCSKKDFAGAVDAPGLKALTLTAFDFPGCGNSSYPDHAAYGVDDLVEITYLVVSQLSLDDHVIIGHSMGGLVGLLYIKKYGKHVKGFINIEGNLGSEDCFLSREMTEYSFEEFENEIFLNFKRKLSRSKNIGFKKYGQTLERFSDPRAFFDYCSSIVKHSDNGKLIQSYTELKIPRIFMYGSENRTFHCIAQLKDKGCEVVEISGSGHFPFYDNPAEYYEVITDFLKLRIG